MSGDLTLKIDADTARYIQKIAEAAQANKALTDSAAAHGKQLGEADKLIDSAVNKLGKHLGLTGLIAAAAATANMQYQNWVHSLEKARDIQREISELGKVTSNDPTRLGALRSQVLSAQVGLSQGDRVRAAVAFKGAAPTAPDSDVMHAIYDADRAQKSGLDPMAFAEANGKLYGLGNAAPDVAKYLLDRGGNQGPGAVDLASRIAAKLGSQQAMNAQGTIAAASRTPEGLDLLGRMFDTFTSQGRAGDFSGAVRNFGVSLAPDLGSRSTLQRLQANLAGEQEQRIPGRLEASADAALMDPVTRGDYLLRRGGAKNDATTYRNNVADSLKQAGIDQMRESAVAQDVPFLRLMPNVTEALGRSGVLSGGDGAMGEASRNLEALDNLSEEIRNQTDQLIQNSQQNRRPVSTMEP